MFRKESSEDGDKKRKKMKEKKHGTEYEHNKPETNIHEDEPPEKYEKFIIIHSDINICKLVVYFVKKTSISNSLLQSCGQR